MYNQKLGQQGEELAVQYLQEKGYTILHTNWRFKFIEIDIIASRNNTLHFIEVKTRRSTRYGQPEESVGIKKCNNSKRVQKNINISIHSGKTYNLMY